MSTNTDTPFVCPITRTITEIRTGGFTDELDDPDCARVIKIGGNDSQTEIIYDDVSFYIMSRKLALARFEIAKPGPDEIAAKSAKMFMHCIGKTYMQLYNYFVEKFFAKNHLYKQFTNCINLTGELENAILETLTRASRAHTQMNVSIPNLFLFPAEDRAILYRPDILTSTINKLIDYVNRYNVNSLISARPAPITHLEPFGGSLEQGQISATNPTTIAEMQAMLAQELTVAGYVSSVEKYHCAAIGKLNDVFDACKKIINELAAHFSHTGAGAFISYLPARARNPTTPKV